MKLEALFKTDGKKLIRISDSKEYEVKDCLKKEALECQGEAKAAGVAEPFFAINIPWTLVGLDEESYNEQFLSDLRDYLKVLDEKQIYVYINPVVDCAADTLSRKEDLVASFKHCARRIKDCTSVVGFAVPDGADEKYFIEEMNVKHSHYIYFVKKSVSGAENVVLL